MSEPNHRASTRDPITNLLAVAAMPGLEEVAAPLAGVVGEEAAVAMLVYLAAVGEVGSHARATNMFVRTDVWQMLRLSASQVGRTLPMRPPTYDKFKHLRNQLGPDLVDEVDACTNVAACALALEVGHLKPDPACDVSRPERSHTVVGDATTFESAPGRNGTGTGLGHLNKDPEVTELDEGRTEPDTVKVRKGVPLAALSVRDDRPQSRVVLGTEVYTDGDELGASMRILERVVACAGGGVHALAYDRLLSDPYFERVMAMGVVPVARMTAADSHSPHVVDDRTVARERKASVKRRNKGDVRTHKKLLRSYPLDPVAHTLDDGTTCTHTAWAVDGSLVVLDADRPPVLADERIAPDTLRWRDGSLVATYRVGCTHGPFVHTLDLGSPYRKGTLVRVLRPVPESAPWMWKVFGWREDIESLFNNLKHRVKNYGRANSRDVLGFRLEAVGMLLLENAVAWDVHVAHHTRAARHNADLVARRQSRAS